MSTPWDAMRTAYAGGATCDQLAEQYGVPAASIKRRAKYSGWGVDRRVTKAVEAIPAAREVGERVAKTADKAAVEFIQKSVEDLNVFRDKWRAILAKIDTAADLDDAASAISRMNQDMTTMLGIGRKGEEGGRGIVHIQLAAPTVNNTPVIELPAN